MYLFSFDSKSKTSFESEIFSNALKNLHEDNKEKTDFLVLYIYFYLFIWLHRVLVAACGLIIAPWDLSSPTRDGTHIPLLEGRVLTTGPPGKCPPFLFLMTLGKSFDSLK